MNAEKLAVSCDMVPDRIVMFGAAIPQDVMDALMVADPYPQVQTHKLSWAIIRGMEYNNSAVDLISTVPISDFPKSRWLWSGYRKWDRGNASVNRLAPFVNILGLKQLTRFISGLVLLLHWAIHHRGEKLHVFQYGLIASHLYAARFVKLIFPITTTILITDLPGLVVIGKEPWWRSALKVVDRDIIRRAVRSADSLIVLTKQISDDYAPGVPAMVMEGMVSVETEKQALLTTSGVTDTEKEFIILYAGGLQRIYGIPLLLEAFGALPGDNNRLWLFGSGDMESEIRQHAVMDHRIVFFGLVSPDQVFLRCKQASVLINPRPAYSGFSPYSFPSKLLEYMASGRPVLTTRLPGIPCEYDPFLLWIDQETPEGLSALLQHLASEPKEELHELGRRGKDFVLSGKNFRQQGRRIREFILK
jgi:glycosyltransferase involved in cell wall biosynthesis